MQQAQMFLFGIILIWLIGTGKLVALLNALKNDPNSGGGASISPASVPGSGGNPQISPGVG
jgi:hypothetical protein